MATLYILFSEKLNKYYIGSCKDLQKRLESHNNKSFYNAFTINSDETNLFEIVPRCKGTLKLIV